MKLEEACEPVFARHETFHPRYGWLKKAYDAGSRKDDLFNQEEAVVQLGVGKNMVKSIRHWGLAFKVLESTKLEGSRRPSLSTSEIGRAWFHDDVGVDPYMELPGTDWLMHWWLLAPKSQAPVWWHAFHEFTAVEFTEEQLMQSVTEGLTSFGKPQSSSIKKDVSVLLRMYSSGHNVRATFEDKIDCPFRELGLLQPSTSGAGAYRFLIGPKPTLPSRVFAATVLDFVHRTSASARTVNLSRALTEVGSPGRTFRLTDEAVLAALEEASALSKAVRMTSSAGMPQLVLSAPPGDSAAQLLREHYADHGADLRWREQLAAGGAA